MFPTLADRPIIVKPKMPLAIEAGEEVILYLSTPVWIRIKVADAKKPLREFPVFVCRYLARVKPSRRRALLRQSQRGTARAGRIAPSTLPCCVTHKNSQQVQN